MEVILLQDVENLGDKGRWRTSPGATPATT